MNNSLQCAKKTALLESKKLALVLDLDHTLLHAAPVPFLPPAECLARLDLKVLTIHDVGSDPFSGGIGVPMARHHVIKLRPGTASLPKRLCHVNTCTMLFINSVNLAGIAKFLEEANQLYQLFIYTAGTRKYAEGYVTHLT